MGSFEAGQKILHYRVVEKLGEGGMGEVYKADDLKLGRPVALKLLHGMIAQDDLPRRRLLREARSASALNHPNIVTIHAIEEFEGVDFIVMEFVEGETLKDRLRRGPLEPAELCEIGAQAASALAAAHAIGIIHRDIKPANIVITSEGRVKVLDFGLAKPLPLAGGDDVRTATFDTDLTDSGVMVGTVVYMSPEQTRGEPLDPRSDVFSMGTVLYETATGQPPFEGPSVLSIIHRIAADDPAPPSETRPDLPSELDLVFSRCLAKGRDDRYESAAALAEALRGIADSTAGVEAVGPQLAPAGKRLGPFVGREAELDILDRYLRESVSGFGKLVFVTGEAGIGKTALVEEFTRRLLRRKSDVVLGVGRCLEQFGGGEAYLPFLDALGNLISGTSRERVVAVLRERAPTWCLQLPAVFASSDEVERFKQDTIGATKARMLREMGDALEALSAKSPVTLLLEDLHWSDPPSIDLLRYLSQRIERNRLLLIGTFRPAEIEVTDHRLRLSLPEMRAHGQCHELGLGVLGEEEIEAYLDQRFSPNDFPEEFAAVLRRKTDGHPLFSTSLVQYLVQQEQIGRSDDRWSLMAPLSEMELEVPESVRSMVRKQIRALAEDDQRALQYAATLGDEFLSTVLSELLEVDDVALEERLDRLAEAHHLIESLGEEELPDGSLSIRYQFGHALQQNVLYEDLATKRRVGLHRAAGERLLAHYGDRAGSIAAELATHFERGRSYGRAAEYWERAGDNAAMRYANEEALSCYSHALRLAERLPPEERARRSLELCFKCARVHLRLGEWEKGAERFSRAHGIASRIGQERLQIQALAGVAATMIAVARIDESLKHGSEALRIAQRIQDPAFIPYAAAFSAYGRTIRGEWDEASKLLTDSNLETARKRSDKLHLLLTVEVHSYWHSYLSNYEKAAELLEEQIALASELREPRSLYFGLLFLAWAKGSLGLITQSFVKVRESLEMAERNHDIWLIPRMPIVYGWLYRELGDHKRATEENLRGLEMTRQAGFKEAQVNALVNLGVTLARSGNHDEALARYREAGTILGQTDFLRWRIAPRLHCGLVELRLAQGDLDEAETEARRVLDLATRHHIGTDIAVGHKLLGEVAMARGDLESAGAELQAAAEQHHRHPSPLAAWRTHAALGRLHRKAGNDEKARDAFGEAAEIVEMIASNTDEEDLRSKFMSSPAVREVLRGAGSLD